jgi:hypothetical protein
MVHLCIQVEANNLDFVLQQQHVGDSLTNVVLTTTLAAHQSTLLHVNLSKHFAMIKIMTQFSYRGDIK